MYKRAYRTDSYRLKSKVEEEINGGIYRCLNSLDVYTLDKVGCISKRLNDFVATIACYCYDRIKYEKIKNDKAKLDAMEATRLDKFIRGIKRLTHAYRPDCLYRETDEDGNLVFIYTLFFSELVYIYDKYKTRDYAGIDAKNIDTLVTSKSREIIVPDINHLATDEKEDVQPLYRMFNNGGYYRRTTTLAIYKDDTSAYLMYFIMYGKATIKKKSPLVKHIMSELMGITSTPDVYALDHNQHETDVQVIQYILTKEEFDQIRVLTKFNRNNMLTVMKGECL